MTDHFRGKVTKVIDGDTFEVKVSRQSRNNDYCYNDTERIRIEGTDAPELGTRGGARSKAVLQRKLNGREVRCAAQARDKYGRIIAGVKPV